MSASKQRANVSKGDFDTFKKGVSVSMSATDTKKLFDDLRAGMGMSKVK